MHCLFQRYSPVTTEVWHCFFEIAVKLTRIDGRFRFIFIPKACEHLRESCTGTSGVMKKSGRERQRTQTRREVMTKIQEKNRNRGRTFCQLGVFFGKLLLPVSLQEAVVAQAARVRQTLHYCIEETLGGRRSTGWNVHFGEDLKLTVTHSLCFLCSEGRLFHFPRWAAPSAKQRQHRKCYIFTSWPPVHVAVIVIQALLPFRN